VNRVRIYNLIEVPLVTGLSLWCVALLLRIPYRVADSLPSSFPDSWFFLWNISHLVRWKEGLEPLYYSSQIFHPYGASLTLHTMVEGIFVPLIFLFPGGSVYDLYLLAVVALIVANILASYLLFRMLAGQRLLSFLLALIFGFHPYFIAHLDAGHINLLFFFPLPLLLAATVSLYRSDRFQVFWILVVAVSAGWLPYGSLYYSYFAGLIAAIALLFLVVSRSWRALGCLSLGAIIGSILAFPKILRVIAAVQSDEFTPDHNPALHGADIFSYLVPGHYQILGKFELFAKLRGEQILHQGETSLYLGVALLLLIISLLVSKRGSEMLHALGLLLVALLFVFFSFGPALYFAGESVVPLAFNAALSSMPFYPSVPVRFGIVSILVLFALVALLLRNTGRSLRVFALCFLSLLALELFPVRPQFVKIPGVDLAREIGGDREITAIVDFGLPEGVMGRQAIHGKPVVAGMLARRPREALHLYRRNRFLTPRDFQREFESGRVEQDFKALEVDGILAPVDDSSLIQRLDSLPWLLKMETKDGFVLYRIQA